MMTWIWNHLWLVKFAQYGVKIEIGDEEVFGLVNTVAPFINNEVVYIAPDGKFYRGLLESQEGFSNILQFAGNCEEVVLVKLLLQHLPQHLQVLKI